MKARFFSALIVTIMILAGSFGASLFILSPQSLMRRLTLLAQPSQHSRSRTNIDGQTINWNDEQRDTENLTLWLDNSSLISSREGFSQSNSDFLRRGDEVIHPSLSLQLGVEKIVSLDQLLALEPEWNELHRIAGSTLPFATFAWSYNWWRHYHEERLAVKDSLSIFVARKPDGAVVAIAPMMLTEHPGVGPVRFKFLQFLGADPNLTELRGPLLHPDFEGSAFRSIVDTLKASTRTWNWIKWSGIRANSIGAAIIEQNPDAQVSGECSDYLLPLAPSWDEFRKTRKKNIRESIRKCYHSLARDGHTFSFSVARTPEEIEASLPIFFGLHKQRAQSPNTIPHADYFGSSRAQDFLRDVCRDMAKNDCARIFTLSIGGQAVAARIGFVLNGSLYLYYSGYDPNWGKYSVMTTVVAEAIRYGIANGISSVGLSTGKDVSKTRWGPDETVYNDFLHTSSSLTGLLAHRTYMLVHRARKMQAIKGVVRQWLYRRPDV